MKTKVLVTFPSITARRKPVEPPAIEHEAYSFNEQTHAFKEMGKKVEVHTNVTVWVVEVGSAAELLDLTSDLQYQYGTTTTIISPAGSLRHKDYWEQSACTKGCPYPELKELPILELHDYYIDC